MVPIKEQETVCVKREVPFDQVVAWFLSSRRTLIYG